MKKKYLVIGIGLILAIGTYLITTSGPTACDCMNYYTSGIQPFTPEEIREREKLRYQCSHKYHGVKRWDDEAREECWRYWFD